MEDWAAAAEEASECLKLVDTKTTVLEPKALFRRAKAYLGTGRTEDAMKDLQRARQLCGPTCCWPIVTVLALCG